MQLQLTTRYLLVHSLAHMTCQENIGDLSFQTTGNDKLQKVWVV